MREHQEDCYGCMGEAEGVLQVGVESDRFVKGDVRQYEKNR